MIKLENKPALKKVAYTVTISMAVISVLFITGKEFSKVKLSNTITEKQNIDIASLTLAPKRTKKEALTIASRSSQELRSTVNETKANTEKKEETQKNKDSESKVAKTETKNNSSKKATTKSEQKTTTSKKTTTKNSSNKENSTTKKSSSKNTTTESKKSATTTFVSGTKISKTMDLTKRTGLSRDEFIKLISSVKADTSGFFEDNAGKIYDLCQKYSINEIFFCGLISAESGWNIASNHRKTHNYISLMRNGKLINYGSVDEGLEVAAQKLHYNYLTPGGKFYHGKTLSGVKTCFCPSSGWVDLVYGRMKQIV